MYFVGDEQCRLHILFYTIVQCSYFFVTKCMEFLSMSQTCGDGWWWIKTMWQIKPFRFYPFVAGACNRSIKKVQDLVLWQMSFFTPPLFVHLRSSLWEVKLGAMPSRLWNDRSARCQQGNMGVWRQRCGGGDVGGSLRLPANQLLGHHSSPGRRRKVHHLMHLVQRGKVWD